MESPYKYFARAAEEAEAKGWQLDLATTSVLAYILAASRHGVASAGRKAIAAFYGLTERQVRNSTGQLVACGAIERISPRSCAVLVKIDPVEASPAKVAPSWPQMIFNNCAIVDCQIDRAATTLAGLEGVKNATNVEVNGNQIVIRGGKIIGEEERPRCGQDGRETAENATGDGAGSKSVPPPPIPPLRKKEELYINTPQPPKGGVTREASPCAPAPAPGVVVEPLSQEVGAVEAEAVTGGSAPCAPKNETRGRKDGLGGQTGAVVGAAPKSSRKTASKSLFADCPDMLALADASPCGGDPVPDAARLAAAYPDWDAKGVDLSHYWLACSHWSDKEDVRRTPRGWKSTLAEWMRRDEAEGRLVTTPGAASPTPDGDLFSDMTKDEFAAFVAAVSADGEEEERRRQSVAMEYRRLYGQV